MRHGRQIEFLGRTILHVTIGFGGGRFSAVPYDQPKGIGRLTVRHHDDLWLPLSKGCCRNEQAHRKSKQREEFDHVLRSYPRNDTYFVGINWFGRKSFIGVLIIEAPNGKVPLDFSIPVWYHHLSQSRGSFERCHGEPRRNATTPIPSYPVPSAA